MTVIASARPAPPRENSGKALKASASLWFLTALLGQGLFFVYILSFYGGTTARGAFADWNKVLYKGYVPGDRVGNLALGMHLLMALIVTGGGALQLFPAIRARAPSFHRWNGRVFLFTSVAGSLVGLYLIWIRGGTVGGFIDHLGTSLDAILIIGCAVMTLRYALKRDFSTHRRWALRLYLLANAVWFYRIGLMFWLVVNQRPVGFDPQTFQGPFLEFLSIAQWALPLVFLELYCRVQKGAGPNGRWAMTAALTLASMATGIGIFGAAVMMWLPHI